MGKRGRKQDCSTEESRQLKKLLYSVYDRLMSIERAENRTRSRYLQRAYYAELIYDMHIVPYSKEYIGKLLTNRVRYDKQ